MWTHVNNVIVRSGLRRTVIVWCEGYNNDFWHRVFSCKSTIWFNNFILDSLNKHIVKIVFCTGFA